MLYTFHLIRAVLLHFYTEVLLLFKNCFSPFVSLWFCHDRRSTYTSNSESGIFPDSMLHSPWVIVSWIFRKSLLTRLQIYEDKNDTTLLHFLN